MNASFHTGNRKRLYEAMKPASLLVMFSGEDVRCPAFPTFALSTSSRRIFTRWRRADTTP